MNNKINLIEKKAILFFLMITGFLVTLAEIKTYPIIYTAKDTVSGMIIYNEENDSVVYNPDKGKKKTSSENNPEKEKETQVSIDKYLKKLKDAERKNNTKEITALLDSIANFYTAQKNYQEAIIYIQKYLKKKEESGDRRGMAKTLNNLGSVLFNAGKSDESIVAYLDAIKIRNELKDRDEESNLLRELANIYQYNYKTEEAIKTLEQSVRIKTEINDQKGVASVINKIGNLYFEDNKIDKAITYFEQTLELEKKSSDKVNIAASFNNIGIAWFKKGDYTKAKDYFQKALDIYKEINDKKGISSSLNNLANIYYNQKDYTKSLENYESSLKLKTEIKDDRGLAILKHNIGNIYKEKKIYQKAKQYYEESSELARRVNFTDVMAKNMLALSQLYSSINDYKNAFENFKFFVDAKHLLENEDKENQLSELQEKYSQEKEIHRLMRKISKQDILVKMTSERNKQALLIRDLELGKKEELVKKQTIFIIFTVIVLLIIIIFSFLLFRQFKKLKKGNRLLRLQKDEIENKKKLLEEVNLKLEEVNVQLEKLSIVASETDNGVVIMDKDCNFEWVNEGFTRLYGFTLQSLIEMRGKNLISASANPNVRIAVMSCLKQKISVRYETNYPDVYGKKIWTQTTLTPIIDNQGNIIKLVAIDSDITKIKNIEEEVIRHRDEIELQRDQITKQRDYVMKQRDEISHQKEEITEGIIYAQHIQTAILPPDEYIKQRLPQYFIIYQPRDIVSGDFYWVRRIDQYVVFTAADCTGHGVPAALMSMMGSALLNEILNNYVKDESRIPKPGNILEELRDQIIKSLHQTSKIDSANDGMDMSLCIFNTETLVLQYAGANSPLYIVPAGLTLTGREFPASAISFNENLPGIEIKADKMPISIHHFGCKPFTDHEVQLAAGDTIYLFSDGYIDQFGGPKYVKFRAKRFQEILIQINGDPMDIQKKILEDTIQKWRGNMEQIDDILVFGVRI